MQRSFTMETWEGIDATDVVGAREEILDLIQGNLKNNIIYFDGWNGFGATAVLRSIAQAIPSMKSPPPKLCFGRTIYIDCSWWESKRVMQRKIAEELKLDRKTIAIFEEQDEEDDFNGVDHGSRDVIRRVSEIIAQTLSETRFFMVLINGSVDEISLTEFGILEYFGMIIWTFGRRFVTTHEYRGTHSSWRISQNLRHTGLFIFTRDGPTDLSDSQLNALFREEAANIVASYPFMKGMDLRMVIDCCRYGFFLRYNSGKTFGLDWAAHSPNFWMCDGIIQKGDRAREISNALDSEITLEGDDSLLGMVFAKMAEHSESSHLLVEDEDDGDVDKYKKRPYRWISVTSKNKVLKDNMQTILATASSIFLSFDKTVSAPRLPNDLFKHCSKLGVLILSYCAFSFVSPPFLHCNTLRFLGLDNCTHQNNTSELEGGACITKWTSFLQNLLVLDLRYTEWVDILSEEKIALTANLIELNIQGVRCWQYTSQLLKSLPYLQRLRIVKPVHKEETSTDINNSFVDKKQLEILDLSGNSYMKSLPASLSEASKLQVLVLDGCYGLEHVVLPSTSLRSFSFDGYGPASNWTSTGKLPPMSSRPESRPSGVDNKDVTASKVSVKGCTQLDNLFLRGLPNLEELDLSGCAIKVLDFGAMVVDVPRLKRLFLLGCENLNAIKWGSYEQRPKLLELICIDTRPRVGYAEPLSLRAQQKSFKMQLHAIFVDARLARSLWAPINSALYFSFSFSFSFTSSATCMETIQHEAITNKEKVSGSIDYQRHYDAIAARDMYGDVFTKVGDGPAPMQAFPLGPTGQLDRHIEIGEGSSMHSEMEANAYGNNLASFMTQYTESLHVHDVSTCINTMPTGYWQSLRWCRVERCPNLHAIFPPGAEDWLAKLETIWASDLRMAQCVWSKGVINDSDLHFRSLRHLHLRCCPSLQFGLAMARRPSFPSLETLHIINCGELRHIFVLGDEENKHTSIEFPKLTTIHLHDIPALQQICEAAQMLAPALETIKIRGCWSLRRLPALKGRDPDMSRPVVEIEKDVWDALEWDGVDAGHHPSLYEAPVHSRYYKRRMLRTTVLR